MPEARITEILDYWFEGVQDGMDFDRKKNPFKKWFISNKAVDAEIQSLFKDDLNKAAEGAYKGWEASARGRLALIILFDQFSRNMYRDQAEMYAFDALALELVLRSIDEGKDKELMLIERAFFYLPLMHFEDLSLQKKSVQQFEQLVKESKEKHPDNTPYYEYSLKHAIEHHDTVAEHGRFPHRDAILNR